MAVVGVSGGPARWPRAFEIEWLTAEELVREAFQRSRVVMMNEATSGLRRSVRTRRTGTRILPVAWAAGARLLAVETMGPPGGEPHSKDVLAQPEMAELLATARRLGFRLSGYDADGSAIPIRLRTRAKSPAFSNWRDGKQAANLDALLKELPADASMLVWAGNLHHAKVRFMQYQPTGWRFRNLSGVDPFVIDQAATVTFVERRSLSPILQWAQAELRRRDGEAGFIWREGMPRLSPGSDAWVLSLDNRME
ncbi:MAG TPA: hypothetical protein VOB72_16540 [Candidatus Dormibacteraeota bacterium]|nr:hypothetical protein [Candidatus Dormibacteraeota bacterium]